MTLGLESLTIFFYSSRFLQKMEAIQQEGSLPSHNDIIATTYRALGACQVFLKCSYKCQLIQKFTKQTYSIRWRHWNPERLRLEQASAWKKWYSSPYQSLAPRLPTLLSLTFIHRPHTYLNTDSSSTALSLSEGSSTNPSILLWLHHSSPFESSHLPILLLFIFKLP